MQCSYFGICGSCRDYEEGYDAQLKRKIETVKTFFKPYYGGEIEVFNSKADHYRSRAEFKIYRDNGKLVYAMSRMDKQGVVFIDRCPIVREPIAGVMETLLDNIAGLEMDFKLFGADFLSSSSGEVCVTLLYHRSLDDLWREKATLLAQNLGIHIIGRSRGQKVVIGQDFVTETIPVGGREYRYIHIENSFTQPNAGINSGMIEWSLNHLGEIGGDLLELYCGAGNFTIPFASKFDKVLATEIAKSSISAAKENMALNGVENIDFVRLSAEEFTQALDGVREFNRMKGIDLESYRLKTLFVDPPRAGLGEEPCAFASRFDHVLYISCNPETLARDLEFLGRTHDVTAMAAFDQFPYTHHLEMGAKLVRRKD